MSPSSECVLHAPRREALTHRRQRTTRREDTGDACGGDDDDAHTAAGAKNYKNSDGETNEEESQEMGRVFMENAPASEADLHHTYGAATALGIRKIDPIVMTRHDPASVGRLARVASMLSVEYRMVCADENALLGDLLTAVPCRGVALDDVHLASSYSAPLESVEAELSERDACNANIPCVVWRRALREDIHAKKHPRTLVAAVGIDVGTLEAVFAPFHNTCVALFDKDNALGVTRVPFNTLAQQARDEMGASGMGASLDASLDAMVASPRAYQVAWSVLVRLLHGLRALRAVERLVQQSSDEFGNAASASVFSKASLRALAYQTQLFMDTHLALYTAVDASGRGWADRAVVGLDAMGCMPCGHGILARAYPHCRAVASCEGELPDLGALIACTSMHHDQANAPSNDLCLQRAAVHLFVLKVMNHPWMMRSFPDMLKTYLVGGGRDSKEGYPSLRALFFRVIECGLLGNWKTTRHGGRAVWQRRLDVYRSVRDMATRFDIAPSVDRDMPKGHREGDVDGATLLQEWIDQNSMVCFYVFKEHLVRQVELLPAFDLSMHWTTRWGHFKALVRDATQRMRVIHNDRCRGISATASRAPTRVETDRYVAQQLRHLHDVGKKNCSKLHKQSFVVVVVHQMDVVVSSLRCGQQTRQSLRAQEKDLFFFRPPRYEGDDDPAKRDTDDLDTEHADIERDDTPDAEDEDDDVSICLDESDDDGEDMDVDDDMVPLDTERMPRERTQSRTRAPGTRNRSVASVLTRKVRALARRMQPYVDVELMDLVVGDACRRQQSTDRIEMRWLDELFGLVERHAEMVRRLYMRHERYDLKNNRIKTILGHLYYCSPRDFHVLRLYLCLVLWHRRRPQFIVLDRETRHRQLCALRRRYKVPPLAPLHRHFGWAHYNPLSMRWADMSQRRQHRRTDRMITHRRRCRQDADALEAIHCRRRVRRFHQEHAMIAEERGALMRTHFHEWHNAEIEASTLGMRATSSFIDSEDEDDEDDAMRLMPWPRPHTGDLPVYERPRRHCAQVHVETRDWPPGDATDPNGKRTCRTNVFMSDADRDAYLASAMVANAGHWSVRDIDCVKMHATDMVGVAVYMNGRIYTRCVDCGVVMRLGSQWRSVAHRGPTCGLHDVHAWTHRERRYLRRMRIDRIHHTGTALYLSQAGQSPAASLVSRWFSSSGDPDTLAASADECYVCRVLGPCQSISPYSLYVARERAENAKITARTTTYCNTGMRAAVYGVGAESRKEERESATRHRSAKNAQSLGRRCSSVLVLSDRTATGCEAPAYCQSIAVCRNDARLAGDLLRYAAVCKRNARIGVLPPPLNQVLDVCALQRASLQRSIARQRKTALAIAKQHMAPITLRELETPES